MLVDLRARNADFTGAAAEKALEAAGIIANKNGDPERSAAAEGHQRPTAWNARGHHARLEGGGSGDGRRLHRPRVACQGRSRNVGENPERGRRVLQAVSDAALSGSASGRATFPHP